MKLYFAKVNWYDNYSEKDNVDKCFVFAENYGEACEQINYHFDYINSIKIEEINDCGKSSVLFVPNDKNLIQGIKNANI